ncbi:MAG: calcium-binding protein [Microcoleaceae cyanobacterium]
MAKFSLSPIELSPLSVISGTLGPDSLSGTPEPDTIGGGAGDDTLFGLEGNDNLNGNNDSDLIFGNPGDDIINASAGRDTIYGGKDNDRIDAASGHQAFGNLGNDFLIGSGSATLFGGQGNDSVFGGDGNQFLSGDRGQDTLRGDVGDDTFIVAKTADPAEIPNRTENADIIAGFNNNEDKFALVGTTFEQLIITEITSLEVNVIFGAGRAETAFSPGTVKFLKIESGGEILAVTGIGQANFNLQVDDFVIF